MKLFYMILANTLVASVTNNFVWFAVTFWAYLETQSVLATSIIGGSYMLCSALFGLLFGTYVDHHAKKLAMIVSSGITLFAFVVAAMLYVAVPDGQLLRLGSVEFWFFVVLVLSGAVAGNLRTIALATTVTMLVPTDQWDRANGLVGTTNGISFTLTSVFSGLAIGMLGMGWVMGIAIVLTACALVHLLGIPLRESSVNSADETDKPKTFDWGSTWATVSAIPGLWGLILFTTFNNFLNGIYIALMDAYGLSLVSVETWGILWAVVSSGFIFGGLFVAKKGLGSMPLRTLFLANIVMWLVSIAFPVYSSIVPLFIGMLVYMSLIPAIEAAEQTIIQKVVPFKRQGRVFGFAQSVESAAAPITAFLIGPIAQFWIIPSMSSADTAGVFGRWFGTGTTRAIAFIFIGTGIIGLLVTLIAMASRAYKLLSEHYASSGSSSSKEA